MGIVLAILLFGFIVFFHELGHFLLAKKNKIDVDEFAVGMGPALFQKTYKGTRYSIRLLPIGGYCAMGEDEEATDSPNNFNNKSVWARISVIAAGPVFNFILAWIFSVILIFMIGYDQPVIGSVEDEMCIRDSSFISGWSDNMAGKDPADYFSSDGDACGIGLNTAGDVVLGSQSTTITLQPNGGTLPEYSLVEGAALPIPSRIGYTFAGWYGNPEFSGDPVTDVPTGSTVNLTFYAAWTPNTYTCLLYTSL